MTVNDLTVGIGADIAGLQRGLDQAGKELSKFDKQIQSIGKLGDQFTSIGKKMSVGITAPLIAIGGLGVKMFSDFSGEMAKVAAISGATSDELEVLTKSAKDLGNSTRFSSSEVATLQLNLSKLGFNPKAIDDATASILDLALATGEDLAQSAEVAASTLQGFGLSTQETARVADVMAKSFSSSALDLGKFSNAMSKVAPVSKEAGVSLEETTAFLSILSDAGLEASVSGTSLRNIFLQLSKEGISLDDALESINTATDKTTRAMDLFGVQGATAAVILANNVKQSKALSKEYKNAEGSAKSMAKVMDDTLQGTLLSLKSAWEGVLITIGENLAPAVAKLASILRDTASAFNSLSPATQKTVIVIGALAASVGPLLLAVGGVLKAVPILILGFKGIAGIVPAVVAGVKALNVAMLANPYIAIAAALVGIGAALTIYIRKSNAAEVATNSLNRVRTEANISIAGEVSELQSLIKVAENETLSKEDRLNAIKKINDISPEYLGNIDLETIKTGEATKAIDAYIDSLNRQAIEQITASKRAELLSRKLELANEAYEVGEVGIGGYLNALKKTIAGDTVGAALAFGENITKSRKDEVDAIDLQIEALDALVISNIKENKILGETVNSINEVIGARARLNAISFGGDTDGATSVGGGLAEMFEEDNARLKLALEARRNAMTDSELAQLEFNIKSKELGEDLSNILQGGIAGGIADSFNAIGNALVMGGNIMEAAGQAALSALGGIMQQFGQSMIAFGIAKIAIDKLFSNPLTAIAAGAALVALGAVVKATSASTQGNLQGIGSGGSGSVSNSTGGNYQAPRSNAGITSTEGGRVVFEIEGQKLVGVLRRTMDRNNRLGGELAF